ncbi:membrane bound O-acyl transferase family-domain-containing protein [Truncatella angustata]|uniref:Membrane bound O-acyl transferase family-domain-containing protein n=1 Tax=Truncatella angustata TaxID=152316 RepID=A0A9P8ZZN6_9PEZI|nr:membrane bound O-acyl transferase family-domain-containing protein [Truncatella angustata]KAH6657452.1 membrane bound O-acyl transferase family-domain-containing protein [Truncatella angustata]
MDTEIDSPRPLSLRAPSASIVPHAALYAVQVLALILPPFRCRNHIFAGLIVGLAVYTHLHPHFTNDPGLAQPFSIAWSYYLATLAKLLFTGPSGPEGDFWRIDRPKQEALGYRALSWQKIRWAFALILNQRGVRWNHQVKNVHPVQTTKKSKFLALQTLEFIKCFLIADLLFSLSRRFFFTDANGVVGTIRSDDLTLRHPDRRWSFAKTLVFAAMPYFMLSMQYVQLSIVAVALGISKPEDWPPPFGSIADVTTVRLFWGKYWHQQLRHILTSYTDTVIDALGIPRGTNWSSYTTLYLAFLLSGTFHALSQRLMPRPEDVSESGLVIGFFLFFVCQAVVITVEDFGQWCWRRLRRSQAIGQSRRLARVVGYIWVTWSIWTSLPLAGDTFLRMRMGEENFLPFSLFGPYVDRFVPIPPPT